MTIKEACFRVPYPKLIVDSEGCDEENLERIAQKVFLQYYLMPYEREAIAVYNPRHFEVLGTTIARMTHGAMHAARVAAYVKGLHYFRAAHNDPLQNKAAAFLDDTPYTMEQFLFLVMIAALLHDSARRDEGEDRWDRQSGDICSQFLQEEMQVSDAMSNALAAMICYKDEPKSFFDSIKAAGFTEDGCLCLDYFRQLIHDADCLDIMRIRGTFRMKFLDVLGSGIAKEAIIALVLEVQKLIALQGDQYKDLTIKVDDEGPTFFYPRSFSEERKIIYEHADNVWQKVYADVISMPLLRGGATAQKRC